MSEDRPKYEFGVDRAVLYDAQGNRFDLSLEANLFHTESDVKPEMEAVVETVYIPTVPDEDGIVDTQKQLTIAGFIPVVTDPVVAVGTFHIIPKPLTQKETPS